VFEIRVQRYPNILLSLRKIIGPKKDEVTRDKIKKNGMGEACSTYGGRGEVHTGFGVEISVKETTWKTWVWTGGSN
jgi:hypothetical protein